MTSTRPAAVAGMFYPANPDELARVLDEMLVSARDTEKDLAPRPPKALIVPHAGYVYSGPIAASAYALLAPFKHRYRRVVLLGPAHRVAVPGIALPEAQIFDTPLGPVELDTEAMALVATLPGVIRSARAHAAEHSLEVHLPFLTRVLGPYRLIPLAVGSAPPQLVERVLELLWDGDDTLIVVSSDLTHYLPYDIAQRIDESTARHILSCDAGAIDHDKACGATPIQGLLLAARKKGLVPALLDLRNSADTAGDPSAVVGYGAFAFYEDKPHGDG